MLIAGHSWETLDAEAAMEGVHLGDLPAVRMANIVWARQRAALSEDDWKKWVNRLCRPLPGTKPSQALREFRRRALA